ncbi:MAG: glycerate kinase [Ekhidna sp.]|nr:glycerate kinase [Ekhidna sp.]
MNIILAFDKFRDSLTACEAAEATRSGLLEISPEFNIHAFQLADGGEGSLKILAAAYHCHLTQITTQNAIHKPSRSVVAFNEKTKVAILEMAQHVGLAQLSADERNPMKTSSFGVGEAIRQVLNWGAAEIIIGVGGSATNDGGAGMMDAMGYQFLNKKGKTIHPNGGNLHEIDRIVTPSSFPKVQITLASDVANPLTGRNGATYTYGPQKGAREEDLLFLENNIKHLASKVQEVSSSKVLNREGYGAAGGFPLCACELLGAKIKSGSQLIFHRLKIAEIIRQSSVVITGEGKIDGQTSFGKAITPVLECAREHGKKIILVCGVYESEDTFMSGLKRYELSRLASEMNLDSFRDAYLLGCEAGRQIAAGLKEL